MCFAVFWDEKFLQTNLQFFFLRVEKTEKKSRLFTIGGALNSL
jgi:hypothetical protein